MGASSSKSDPYGRHPTAQEHFHHYTYPQGQEPHPSHKQRGKKAMSMPAGYPAYGVYAVPPGYAQYPQLPAGYAPHGYSAYPYYYGQSARHASPPGAAAPNPLPSAVTSVYETEKYRHLPRRQTMSSSCSSDEVTVSAQPHARARDAEAEAAADARNAEIIANASMDQPSWPFLDPAAFRGGAAGAAPGSSRAPAPVIPGKPFPPGHPALATLRAPSAHGDVAPVHVDRKSTTSGLSHFSQHPVLYKKKLYPSAAHLFEAFKFAKTRPELAARIQSTRCPPSEIARVSAQFEAERRPDWEDVMLEKMEEALYLKFTQKRALRDELLDTGSAPIVDTDNSDSFWATGPDGRGRNEMGKALMRVRARIFQKGGGVVS